MTQRRIRKYGAEVLRRKSEEISEFGKRTQRLFEDLEETLIKAGGLGLAAPQIGVSLRAFVVLDRAKQKIIKIANPQIVSVDSETEIDMEGCLSFPEIFFAISRPKRVQIRGLTDKGKEIGIEVEGILARCFFHEIEHLDGILIIDHAGKREKEFWQEKLIELERKYKK
ncbi:MAG: peptide deformylase [Candidatus Omnitrophica bacterium]|nr:peptide deformylase [Candidatus Omnitrophota bacterium]